MPFTEAYYPELFDQPKIKAVLAGIIKYSMCKEIAGPDASEDCKVSTNDTNVVDGDMGYGYFFETEEDIQNFAAYVYQHHFQWPSLSASSEIGYPTLAGSAYFQTILHNVRVIGF